MLCLLAWSCFYHVVLNYRYLLLIFLLSTLITMIVIIAMTPTGISVVTFVG